MKRIFIIALLLSLASCSNNKANLFKNDEASSRINNSENNSREIFNEIDE